MRDIRFRGWDTEKKEMYGWDKIRLTPFNLLERRPLELMQNTDLKNENGEGEEIYNCDIISSYAGIIKYLIYWDAEQGQWWGRRIQNKTKIEANALPLCEILDRWYMEVIGNIYENPELIEESQ